MSDVVSIGANSNSCDNPGGQSHAYAFDILDVTAVTVTNGVITAITVDAAADAAKYEFDDEDNLAFFNEEPEQVGSLIQFNGSSLMSFNGIDQTKITAGNKVKSCCGVVVIWVGKDGTRRVQGIDVAPDNTWKFSKTKARILPGANSNTGAETATFTYTVNHVGLYMSPTTDLTDTAIEAL